MISADTGIPRARIVAVVAALPGGLEQVGSGYLLDGQRVLTAAHCTHDKKTGAGSQKLRVVRASDGASAEVSLVNGVVAAPSLDVAVLRLTNAPWRADLPALVFARVDRTRSGALRDCAAIGYPLFQRDPAKRSRHTAELHGTINQTDEAESGRLLMREPLMTSVGETDPAANAEADRGKRSPWGGLSGALVFHADRAIGVITEHHPRQGDAAVQLMAFDTIRKRAATDNAAQQVCDELKLPPVEQLVWTTAEPMEPLVGLVDVIDHTSGDLPRVRKLDPYRLGTTPSDYGNRNNYGDHDPYVPRTHHDIDTRLRAALQPSRMVLLVGPSKVGKTRTAFEAVRTGWEDAHLAAPTPRHWPNSHPIHDCAAAATRWWYGSTTSTGSSPPPSR
ncbi:trypsin-like serine peptidase [Streptomyces sp. CBMA123]|uniref:trypsin-like serine peptidase n=1 Tax=Streptomyces sp. CBMA123 TaxID=1896313 RepID=UPI0016619C46|nr:serine protease [Streptomyces sp. CBMA123]MBD0692548.1 hypothetical protein [Streptomyces sp. CBMA123]